MKYLSCLCALLLCVCSTAQAAFEEELVAPDVDFYVELHGTQTDLDELDGDDSGGLRIRLGMDVKSVDLGPWLLRVEGSFNAFGESDETIRVREADPNNAGRERVIDTNQDVRLNGLELGARFVYGRYISIRVGGFIYGTRNRTRSSTASNLLAGEQPEPGDFTQDPNAAENTDSSVAPYIGIGAELPLGRRWRLVSEYDLYIVEGEPVTTIAGGIQYRF